MFDNVDASNAFWAGNDIAEGRVLNPIKVTLKIGERRAKRLHLEVVEQFIIGRRGADDTNAPDLDLTGYDAAAKGLSQRHAALRHRDDLLYIEDLGSTNGTRLNGLLVEAGRLYRLRHADELEFGLIRAQVELPRDKG